MNLPRLSVLRPVFTTMATLIIVVLGVVAFTRLKIDLLPNIERPTLSIRTSYEGASPEVMEQLVTRILEEIVGTVPGVEEITSSSSEGQSRINVRFAWGTNIDAAAIDLQATIEDEMNELPDDVDRPRINKFDINSFPVVFLGVSGSMDPVELTEIVENQIRNRFARIPGIAQVDIWGGYDREIRVELNPDRIKALNLSLNQILQSLRDANLDLPTGQIDEGRYTVRLRAPAQFENLAQIRETVVTNRNGAPVTIGQIAVVKDTYEELTRHVRVNGVRGLRGGIRKQADANTVDVSRAILEEIEAINASMPQVQVVAVMNQGGFIERSIANVAQSVLYGGGLAILVLLFFLRSIRSTVVISLAIPISIVATFALMYGGGLTINLMTLGGLALGVGMMVDSSIVVLENVFRRRQENGEAPNQAAAHGAQEVAGAIVASTVTTLVIFLPLAFVEGLAGVLFKDLALVVVFALVAALFVALSLVPMLCAKLLKPEREPEETSTSPGGKLKQWAAGALNHTEEEYLKFLQAALRHRLITVGAAVMLVVGSLALFPFIGKELMPPSDEGEVRVTGEMEVATQLDLVDQQTRRLEELVFPVLPEAEAWIAMADDREGELRISLVPATERDRSNEEVAQDLRQQLAGKIPGMDIRVRAPQGQFLLNRLLGGDDASVTVEIRGAELDVLDVLADRSVAAITGIEGVTDVRRAVREGVPEREIRFDRAKLADLGLTIRDVTSVLRTAIAGSEAGLYQTDGNAYRILVKLENARDLSTEEVLTLTVSTPTGGTVALGNLVQTSEQRAPSEINRIDQRRAVTVNVNIDDRPLGDVSADVQAALNGIARPAGYELQVAGAFEEQQRANQEMVVLLLMSLLLVYMVLACQYESFRDPLIVMFSTPVAIVGVMVTLFLTETTLNLQSAIGCIMLGGIVVNNAILIVDQARRLHLDGLVAYEAVTLAGRRRLRPILMTTSTTVLGLLPLALGIGEGADAQAPLARAVIGGLLGSTVITLVLIPVLYTLLHGEGRTEQKIESQAEELAGAK